MSQQITVLTTLGPLLAKQWMPDGTITDYDLAKRYRWHNRQIHTIHDLHTRLATLAIDPKSCIIRGRPKAEIADVVERNLDTFGDRPSKLLMVDIDKFTPTSTDPAEMCAEFVATLPGAFHDVTYVWQLSGSMGHPTRAGLRAHLWFWLAEPIGCELLEAWAKECLPGTDSTVHRAVQVNYTAGPVVHTGNDPYAGRRIGITEGMLGDELVLDLASFVADPAATATVKRADRLALNDPRKKQGVIGRVCRAFNPYDLPRLFPETFAKGSGKRKERFTWVAGGGAKEGLRVGDSGQHVLNSHSTSPIGNRAVNIFDLIRTHVHGHLDANLEPDALALDPTAAPSYAATVAWALRQPELQAPEAIQAAKEATVEVVEQKVLEAEDGKEQRTKRIASLLKGVEKLTDIDSLEHDLAPRVAAADLTPGEREVVAAAIKNKTRQLMPGTMGLSLAVVRAMLAERGEDGATTWDARYEDGTPRPTVANLRMLLASKNWSVRYDIIRKEGVVTGHGLDFSRDNRKNATTFAIVSECSAVGMTTNVGIVKGFLKVLADENQYNPALAWIESKPWDGRSRMTDIAGTIVARAGFNEDLKRRMMRKWLIQAAALAASPTPIQARGALIVQGDQYIGKSRWLESLVPGNTDLVAKGLTLNPTDKDSVRTAITHWLAELGELDATFRKSDIAALKAFLAQDVDKIRLPYDPDNSEYQRRTAFYGSVNDEHFLHDMTGNTRFWVIPVERMDHDHSIDMQQVWAEALSLWRGGEPHWFSREEMASVEVSSDNFSVRPAMEEKVLAYFPWDRAARGDPGVGWHWMTSLEVLGMMGNIDASDADCKSIGRAIRKIGGVQSKSNGRRRLIRVPVEVEKRKPDELGCCDAPLHLDPMMG